MTLYCYKLVLGACCKKTKHKIPKVSDGCYAWSHYGGGCETCKSNWNECKCKSEETGCETCMNYLSSCTCPIEDSAIEDSDEDAAESKTESKED